MQPQRYEVGAGRLLDALAALADRSGVRIVFVPATRELEGLLVQESFAGTMDLAEALDRTLAGSGLRWRMDRYGTVRIERGARIPEIALEPLRIEDTPLSGEQLGAIEAPKFGLGERAPERSTLSGELLDAQVVEHFEGLLRRAPNVSGTGSSLSIRGIERGDDTAITASVFLDGIPLGGRALDFGLLGLDRLSRVEYQRGPRSLWEGVGALAGTIRLETAEPSPETELRGRLQGDDQGAYRGRTEAGGSLGDSGLSGRIGLEKRFEPGFTDNTRRGEDAIDRAYQSSGVMKLMYEPDRIEQLTLRLNAIHARGDPGSTLMRPPTSQTVPFDPFDRESFDSAHEASKLRIDGARLEGEWRFNDRAMLSLSGTWSDTIEDTRRIITPGAKEFTLRNDDESRREVEARFGYRFSPQWTALAGATRGHRAVLLDESDYRDVRRSFPAAANPVVAPDSQTVLSNLVETSTRTDSVLLEVEWQGKRWDAALGLRRVSDASEQQLRSRNFLTVPDCTITIGTRVLDCATEFPETVQTSGRLRDEDVTVPHGMVRFRPNEHHTLAFSYREGFLGGGARLNRQVRNFIDFQAERSESIDLGWDAQWGEGLLETRATVFYNRWRDRQVPFDLSEPGNGVVINAGKARAWGGEIEVSGRIGAQWLWWVGMGVLHTEYQRFPIGTENGTEDLAGNRFAGAPARTATAGLAWNGKGGWHAALNAWRSSEAFSDARNTPGGIRPAYEVVDLRAGRRFGHWDVYAYATNVLDEDYLEEVRVSGTIPRASEFKVGRPRQIGVSMEFTW